MIAPGPAILDALFIMHYIKLSSTKLPKRKLKSKSSDRVGVCVEFAGGIFKRAVYGKMNQVALMLLPLLGLGRWGSD